MGQQNTTVLDCSILFDRNEFRKSSHFGQNKAYLRFQETKSGREIQADVYKKIISGESMDSR